MTIRKKSDPPPSEPIDPSPNENDFYNTSIIQDRDFICHNYIRNGKYRYALKKLSPVVEKCFDPQLFVCGVIDLAMEVKFLSILRHPNIIKLRAVADMDSCAKNFFIMLDSLDLTLGDQIDVWRKQKPGGFGCQARKKREEDFSDRLCIGYDICSALSYIHANRSVYIADYNSKPKNLYVAYQILFHPPPTYIELYIGIW